jgi:hypothetical protein
VSVLLLFAIVAFLSRSHIQQLQRLWHIGVLRPKSERERSHKWFW